MFNVICVVGFFRDWVVRVFIILLGWVCKDVKNFKRFKEIIKVKKFGYMKMMLIFYFYNLFEFVGI